MADVEKLIVALKRAAPSSVRVIDATDGERVVAVAKTHRKRWAHIAGLIMNQPWVRCVMLDPKGLEVGYFDNDGAASDLELLSPNDAASGGAAGPLAIERHMRILLEAQKVALSYRDKQTSDMLAGVTEVMKVQTDAIRNLVGLYQAQVELAGHLGNMQAQAENGGDMEQWLKALELAPDAIAKFAPMLQLMFRGRTLPAGSAKPKPNGANGTATNGVKPE